MLGATRLGSKVGGGGGAGRAGSFPELAFELPGWFGFHIVDNPFDIFMYLGSHSTRQEQKKTFLIEAL